MARILIKSFNRPFLLERCLRSIESHARDHDGIILLDDGTESAFLNRIHRQFPTVEIRRSRNADRKYALHRRRRWGDPPLPAEDFDDPGRFWADAVTSLPDDYVFIGEDDAWFRHPVPFAEAETVMRATGAPMLQFFGSDNAWFAARPLEITGETTLSTGARLLHYFPQIRVKSDLYRLYGIAMQLYHRDYWLNGVGGTAIWNDENTLLSRALAWMTARINAGRIPTLLDYQGGALTQSWCSTVTPGQFDIFAILDRLNQAWFDGRLDAMAHYPDDFSPAYLQGFLGDLPDGLIDQWLAWWQRKLAEFADLDRQGRAFGSP